MQLHFFLHIRRKNDEKIINIEPNGHHVKGWFDQLKESQYSDDMHSNTLEAARLVVKIILLLWNLTAAVLQRCLLNVEVMG